VTMVFRQHGRRLRHRRRVHPQESTAPRSCTASTWSTPMGEDVVAGIRTPEPISHLKVEIARGLRRIRQESGQQLEKHYGDVQDLEFTIERGKLYMLQTRIAKRTADAAVKIAVQDGRRRCHHRGRGRSSYRAGPGRPVLRPQFERKARAAVHSASPRA